MANDETAKSNVESQGADIGTRGGLRRFGISLVGEIPWGTHLCQFYETREDLIAILVPYFVEGLKSNEFCMWVTSAPLEVEDAKRALSKVLPDLDRYVEKGQIEFLSYRDWYLLGGTFNSDRVLQGWVQKEKEALARGFEGLRLTGNTFWVERTDWKNFTDYEAAVNDVITWHRMIALCTYSLERCSGSDVVDVEMNHIGTLIRRGNAWSLVEDVAQRKEAEKALLENERLLREARDRLEARVSERTAELARINQELEAQVVERKKAEGEVRVRADQQAVVAQLGQRAVAGVSLNELFGEAVEQVAQTLGVEYCKVLELLPDGKELLLRSGVGWKEGLVGRATVGTGTDSQAGYTLLSDTPVVVEDLRTETRFSGPPLLHEHNVVSGMSVIISGKEKPFGVLGAHTTRRRTFSEDDVNFLHAVANVLATSIEHRQAEEALRKAHDVLEVRVKERTAELMQSNEQLRLEITEREAAQNALRESEERLQILSELTSEGIVIHDKGAIVEANEALARMFGYDSPRELMGKSGFPMLTPESQEKLRQHIAAGSEEPYEAIGMKKDGTLFPIEIFARNMLYKGRPVRVGSIFNLTERKKAENELRETRDYLENLLNYANAPIIVWDPEFKITRFNRAFEHLTGLRTNDVIGRPLDILFPQHKKEEAMVHIKRTLAGELWETVEIPILNVDRTVRIVLWNSANIHDNAGQIIATIAQGQDITERKKAEEEVRSLSRFPAENPNIVLRISNDGKILYSNDAGLVILNEWKTQVGQVAHSSWRQIVADVSKLGIRKEFEEEYGTRTFLIMLASVAGAGYVNVYGRDITERKKAEEKLAEQAFMLANANDAIIAYDPDYRVTFWNKGAEKLYGYTQEEALGKVSNVLFQPTYVGTSREELVKQVTSEGHIETESVRSTKDGGKLNVEAHVILLRNEKGEPIGYVSIDRDITERKRVEQAIRESQADLNRAQAVAKTGSWRLNVQRDELLWSDETYRIFGIPKGTPMTYESFLAGVHPDDREHIDQKWQAALRGERYDVEHRIVVNGIVKWMREKAELEVDKNGSLLGGFGTVQDITERKETEEKILKEKQFSDTLINSLPGVFYAIDADARFLLTNKEFSRVTGYSLEEIAKMKAMDFFGGEERKLIEERIKQVFDKGAATAEAHLQSRNGDARLYYFTGVRIERDGVPILIGMGMDTTERKEMENALRETRDYLDSLLNYANAPIIVWDQGFKITRFNRAFEHLTGYEAEDVLGKHLSLLFPEQSREKSLTEIQHTSAGEHWEVVEIPILRKDGETRTVLWNSANIYGEDEKTLMATIAQGQDITERKQIEDALRETRDYLESLLNYANAPIIVWDPEFKITRFNRAFEHLAGYKAEEVVGKDLRMLFPAESTERSLTEIQHTLTGEYWEVVEIPILRRDGDIRTVLWNSANINAQGGKTLMATIAQGMDITERKKLEEKLKRTERLATIGETAAMVGHDLRNPLQAIVGFIALAEEQLKAVRSTRAKKQKIVEPLKAINQQAQYMNKIVLDLQDYARVLEPELKETQLLNLVKQVFSSIQIPPTVSTSVQIPDNFPKICVDPTLITRALTNLFRNAVEAMPEGGRLTVKASRARGEISIKIRDTGIGIAKENMPKLFIPLFTTKAKGQGFGLPVCKQIIEAHGGTITVRSQPGQGSAFTLKIPQNKRNQKKTHKT